MYFSETISAPLNNDHRRERPTWDEKNNPIEFLLTTLGYLVNLGVVILMPYMIYRNGGIVFLIQYLVALVLFGFPVLLLEMYIGQFTSNGILTCWQMFPLFTGVGYAMLIFCMVIASYTAVINAWVLYYAFVSWSNPLPWSTCDNAWNTNHCVDPLSVVQVNDSDSDSYSYHRYFQEVSPSVEFWHYKFLRLGTEPGRPLWYVVLPLAAIWIAIGLVLLLGTKVYGKIAYIATLLPYLFATILFLRFITLPGAIDGLQYLFYPDFGFFGNPWAWAEAVSRVFFNMGVCIGPIITLSSYNKFRNDIFRDAFLLSIAHFISCIGYAMLVFAMFGFVAQLNDKAIPEIVSAGIEMLFTTMADGFGHMIGSQIWSSLFYFTVSLLCTSTLLAMAETVITAILDLFPILYRFRYIVVICVCSILFLLGLPYSLHIGYALMQGIASTLYLNMAFIGLIEAGCVAFMYGILSYMFTNRAIFRFKDDLRLMLGGRGCHCLPWIICGPYLIIMWCVIVPLLLLFCWIYQSANFRPYFLEYFQLSYSLMSFCYFVMMCPILAMLFTPLVLLLIQCCKTSFSRGLEYLIKPSRFWGPAVPKDRQGMSEYLPDNKFEIDPWC